MQMSHLQLKVSARLLHKNVPKGIKKKKRANLLLNNEGKKKREKNGDDLLAVPFGCSDRRVGARDNRQKEARREIATDT